MVGLFQSISYLIANSANLSWLPYLMFQVITLSGRLFGNSGGKCKGQQKPISGPIAQAMPSKGAQVHYLATLNTKATRSIPGAAHTA